MQQVLERDELVGRVGARAAAIAQRGNPADQAGVELRVRAHRVEDPLGLLDDAGQDFFDVGDRKGIVGAEFGNGLLRARAGAVPGLAVRVAIAAEQDVLALRGRPGARMAMASGSAKPVM